MKIEIFVEDCFAVILGPDYTLHIKGSLENEIYVAYESKATAWYRDYRNIEELTLDNELQPLWKWLARGVLGIPLSMRRIKDANTKIGS